MHLQGLLLITLVGPHLSIHYPFILVKEQSFDFHAYGEEDHPKWIRRFIACFLLVDQLLDEDSQQIQETTPPKPEELFSKATPVQITTRKRKQKKRSKCVTSGGSTVHPRRTPVNTDTSNAPQSQPHRIAPTNVLRCTPEQRRPKNARRSIVRSGFTKSNKSRALCAQQCFHEGCKASSCYERRRNLLMKCQRNCRLLKWNGDMSVCYWFLGGIAFEKRFYSKAMKLYWKAINTYELAQMFKDYQPALSAIYAQHYNASCQRLSTKTVEPIVENPPGDTFPGQGESRAATLSDSEANDYHSHIHWDDPIPRSDLAPPNSPQFLCPNLTFPIQECSTDEQGEHCLSVVALYVHPMNDDDWELPVLIKYFIKNVE